MRMEFIVLWGRGRGKGVSMGELECCVDIVDDMSNVLETGFG